MDVIGHQNKSMQLVAPFDLILSEDIQHEPSIGLHLKEPSPIGCDSCGKEGPDFLRRKNHPEEFIPERGKERDAIGNETGPEGPIIQPQGRGAEAPLFYHAIANS